MPILQERFLFIHIPKTAGTSIEAGFGGLKVNPWSPKSLLSRLLTRSASRLSDHRIHRLLHGHGCLSITPQHLTLNEIVSLGLLTLDELFEKLVCFSVVRNPYSRVISQWQSHNRFTHHPDINDFVRDWLFNARMTKSQDDLAHSRPQSDFIELESFYASFYNRMPEVRVLRFENLEQDYKSFLDKHGVPFTPLPHRKKSRGRKLSYRELLSMESKKMIDEFYERDFKRFGYEW